MIKKVFCSSCPRIISQGCEAVIKSDFSLAQNARQFQLLMSGSYFIYICIYICEKHIKSLFDQESCLVLQCKTGTVLGIQTKEISMCGKNHRLKACNLFCH